jgi:isopentenyl-diphosphate delta-isomerase
MNCQGYRESQLVELVDTDGVATGTCTVADAHSAPGRLHRAFSVMLLDELGHVLIQERAPTKTRFALRWANACCGHPTPGTGVIDAATQRLTDEIGVQEVALHQVGVYLYAAKDQQTGQIEHEYDHILIGQVPADVHLRLDPSEVARVRWLAPDRLRQDLANNPDHYAPWLCGVLDAATEAARHLPAAATPQPT